MRRVLTIGVSLAMGLAMTIPVFARDAAHVDKGKQLFADQKCSMCHSIAGKGNPKGSLDGVSAKLSPAEIKQWITSPKEMAEKTKAARKPPMKEYKNLSAADVDALVAYLQTLKGK